MATKIASYRNWRRPNWRRLATVAPIALLMLVALLTTPPATVAGPIPTVSIAQYPLTVAVPAHPQILLAMGNSESMDGNLSGAIMTGSGSLGAAYAGLNTSSSPASYSIPAGFTPPADPGAAGMAPYTSNVAGHLVDNSPSRLNVAKGGISAILNAYMQYADFALMDYSTGGASYEPTHVYELSPAGADFSFTSTAGPSQVPNPCYNIPQDNANPVDHDCQTLAGRYGPVMLISNPYMNVGASSDDPDANDVLYGAGFGDGSTICIANGGPTLNNYNLASYEVGGVSSSYANGCYATTTPTNAGFLPSTPHVMYIARGWAYASGQNANAGNLVVPMQTSGAAPTPASVTAAIAQFTQYLQPETNQSGSSEIKAQAGQSPVAGLLHGAKTYFQTSNPASNNGCTATRYVVLVTDGLPTLDTAGHAWPPLGTKPASDFGVTASFNADGSLNATNDQALTDTINNIAALQSAGIETYVIGLGAGVDPAANPVAANTLTAMAVAGGTSAFFPATNPQDLTNDMQVILAKILAETAATASSAVNSTGINTTSVAYQGRFTTSDVDQDWTGNLTAYPINATTGDIDTLNSDAKWSAQAQLDAQLPGNRLIATWDPVLGKGVPFEWNPSATAANGIASSTMIGSELMTFAPDMQGQDVLNYLRGDTSLEKRNGGQFRNRSHILGDIVDSSPLYIGGPSAPWQQATYFSFQAMYAHREPLVYIGANDGMLHAFDANTGQEKFAYIPEGVYGNLVNLVNPYYNERHHFYVDGSPTAADMQFPDGSWHTVLLGSERGGGNTIFALDVTDPSLLTSETAVGQAALWEFTDGDMGLTYSTPVAVNTTAGFAVVFGNGYDSPNNKPVVYALNPQTGAVMVKLDLCAKVVTACNGALPNGLSSVVAMNSTGAFLSGTSNVLYAGDLQGNLWRVDISNPNPALWSVSVLFQARDPSGTPQPITVTPAVTLNPLIPTLTGTMVYFATGQLLGIPDLGTTQVQTVYGIFDSGAAPAMALGRGDLQVQTMSSVNVTTTEMVNTSIRLLTSNAVNLPVKHGWFVDLNLVAGERVVTDPALVNGTLQLTSYQPNDSTCTGGGNGWYMVFNYATGGATDAAQFGWNSSDSISAADLYMGQTVSGVSEGAVYAAGPKMVTGAGGAVVYTTSAGAEITAGPNAGDCTNISGTATSCIPKWQNLDSVSHGAWQEIR